MKRAPAFERYISEITPDDIRVKVVGTVVEVRDDGTFLLDDGTGQISVFYEGNVEVGKLVRVIGKVMSVGGTLEIKAEIIQDFSKLDKEIYKKYMELRKTFIKEKPVENV